MQPLRKVAERADEREFEQAAPSAGGAIAIDLPAMPRPAGERNDARMLQARAQAFAEGRAATHPGGLETRWSARRTLVFMVGTTLALWGAIFMTGWVLVRSFS